MYYFSACRETREYNVGGNRKVVDFEKIFRVNYKDKVTEMVKNFVI